jgi:hypothetical protein
MKFILTKELGRLAKWLRILGYDTEYFIEDKISSLVIQALRDNRIILTRNLRMPEACGTKIVYVKSEHIKEQLSQIFKELNLQPEAKLMFSRCIICNIELVDIKKEEVKDKVPEYVFKTQDDFVNCPQCKRIYWQGTHWGNVQKILEEVNK